MHRRSSYGTHHFFSVVLDGALAAVNTAGLLGQRVARVGMSVPGLNGVFSGVDSRVEIHRHRAAIPTRTQAERVPDSVLVRRPGAAERIWNDPVELAQMRRSAASSSSSAHVVATTAKLLKFTPLQPLSASLEAVGPWLGHEVTTVNGARHTVEQLLLDAAVREVHASGRATLEDLGAAESQPLDSIAANREELIARMMTPPALVGAALAIFHPGKKAEVLTQVLNKVISAKNKKISELTQQAQAATQLFSHHRDVVDTLAVKYRRVFPVLEERSSQLMDLVEAKGDRPNDPAQQRLQRKVKFAEKFATPFYDATDDLHQSWGVLTEIQNKLQSLIRQRDRLTTWLSTGKLPAKGTLDERSDQNYRDIINKIVEILEKKP